MADARVPILALIAAAGVSPALADEGIVIAALEAQVAVEPRTALSRVIDLPDLEFALRAVVRCKGEPVSMTLSVADSFTTISKEQLADRRATDLALRVPGQQVALAASKEFCLADDDASTSELLVPGLATAHASLLCERDGEQSAHFASAPLQVRIRCERATDEVQDPPDSPDER